jgi:arylsulfatase A-like enzyme
MLRDAVVFDNAYATSSWTVPSMASLHTGVYPSSHGVAAGEIQRTKGGRRVFAQPALPPELTTIAEMLRSSGYATVGVAANQHLGAQFGFGRGFDRYAEEALFEDARRLNRTAERLLADSFGGERPGDWLTSRTFLWLHYFDPHDPYSPRIPWSRVFAPGYLAQPARYPAYMTMRRIRAKFAPDAAYRGLATPLYEAEIAFVDDQINRLAQRTGIASDDVLLIFTADHGEEFAEHGGIGHGAGLHEEVVRVPLAVRWPRGFSGPRRVSAPVSLVDLFPTIAELAGADAPAGLQGRSLVPLLRGEAGDAQRPILMELDPPKPDAKAWRRGRYKIIRTADERAPGRFAVELYDLSADPGEHVDLSRAEPEIAGRLARELDERCGALPPPPKARVRRIDDEALLQQLINMDYVRDDSKDGKSTARPANGDILPGSDSDEKTED